MVQYILDIQLIHLIVGVSMSVGTSAYGSDQCPQEMDPAIDPASPAPSTSPWRFFKNKEISLSWNQFHPKRWMEGQHFMPWAILCPCYCRQKEINSASQKVQQWPNITESCCSNEKMMINQRIIKAANFFKQSDVAWRFQLIYKQSILGCSWSYTWL